MAERDEPDIVVADAVAEARAAQGAVSAGDLAPLRERIDAIDQEIVALLNERAQIALQIGRVKQVTGRRSVRDARREQQVIDHVTSASAGLFPEPELVALYRKLIAATRRVQHAQRRQWAAADRPARSDPVLAGTGGEADRNGTTSGGGHQAAREAAPSATQRRVPDIPPDPR